MQEGPISKGIMFNEIHLVCTVLFIQSRIFLNITPVCHTQIHRAVYKGPNSTAQKHKAANVLFY